MYNVFNAFNNTEFLKWPKNFIQTTLYLIFSHTFLNKVLFLIHEMLFYKLSKKIIAICIVIASEYDFTTILAVAKCSRRLSIDRYLLTGILFWRGWAAKYCVMLIISTNTNYQTPFFWIFQILVQIYSGSQCERWLQTQYKLRNLPYKVIWTMLESFSAVTVVFFL